MSQVTLKREDTVLRPVLYTALELSNKRWKVAFSNGAKRRHVSVAAGSLVALWEALEEARQRFGLGAAVRVVSCYEAGRYGFWPHWCLTHIGVENVVVDAASLEVSRRQRRVKTDRVDADGLLTMQS